MTIKVKILNRWYESTGKDILDALLKIKVPVVKTGSVVVIGKKEFVLNQFITRNFFGTSNPMNREIAAKQLKERLGI